MPPCMRLPHDGTDGETTRLIARHLSSGNLSLPLSRHLSPSLETSLSLSRDIELIARDADAASACISRLLRRQQQESCRW